MIFLRTIISFVFLLLLSSLVQADIVKFKNSPATEHIVVKGDTLWDIAAKFLQDPWRWPSVWQHNGYIKNPHLIYPGDIIRLCLVKGEKMLCVNEPPSGGQIRWSPKMRSSASEQAINIIPLKDIQPFLNYPLVLTDKEINQAPYVLHLKNQRLITGKGSQVYARTIHDRSYQDYIGFRPGNVYKNIETGEILGYQANYIADLSLLKMGDPATLLITESKNEMRTGDLLMPTKAEKDTLNFFPKAPDSYLEATIIDALKDVQNIGQYDIVVLDKGTRDHFQTGHVLKIIQIGKTISDPFSKHRNQKVKLPDEQIGTVMVFRVFEKVSYALVMAAEKNISRLDRVKTPE